MAQQVIFLITKRLLLTYGLNLDQLSSICGILDNDHNGNRNWVLHTKLQQVKTYIVLVFTELLTKTVILVILL